MSSSPGLVKAVDLALDARVSATLSVAIAAFEDAGWKVEQVHVPTRGLPRELDRDQRAVSEAFIETPAPLIESWRIARYLDAATVPGDIVLVPDRAGVAGMFALEEAMRPLDERRIAVVTAADGLALEFLEIAGTFDGLPDDAAFAIDWELIGYRFAASVLATSELAAERLAGLGIRAQWIADPSPGRVETSLGEPSTFYLPEPVGRRAQFAAMLRALNAVRDHVPGLEVFASEVDQLDLLWTGTTWEATHALREMFGDRLQRGAPPSAPDVVVLGDPYAVPDDDVARLREDGTQVVVPARSTASGAWPDARTWADEVELADVLTGVTDRRGSPRPEPVEVTMPATDTSRARRVSVAVPIFRDVAYLDACVRSILAQDQQVHELILVDDGSRDQQVTDAITSWCKRHPDLITSLSQPNRGVCAARNLALGAMTGDAFLLVDSDDELRPAFVRKCADALRANPDLRAVATWTEFFGDYNGIEAKPPFDRRTGRRENTIISTCAVVDMAVRDQGIRFEPDLAFLYCEDWDVWARIVAAGGSFGLVPEPLARHRVRPGQGAAQRTATAHALGKARATSHLGEIG